MVLPCHPDGRTFAASNFRIEASRFRTRRMVVRTVDLCTQFPYLIHSCPDHDDWRPDVWI
jgi:hypothetical protein